MMSRGVAAILALMIGKSVVELMIASSKLLSSTLTGIRPRLQFDGVFQSVVVPIQKSSAANEKGAAPETAAAIAAPTNARCFFNCLSASLKRRDTERMVSKA